MKKLFLFASIVILSLTLTGLFFFGAFQSNKNQTIDIIKKFKKDSIFIHDELRDLPLLLFENKNSEKDYFVILFSGDGGWRGFISEVANSISTKGASVVGVNLLTYLKQEKKPEQMAKDIHRIINTFSSTLKKKKVIIGGYSFGGEIIPFFYNKMDSLDKNRVEKMFFIGISNAADFKVSPVYYYNPKYSKPVLPQIQCIKNKKFLFFCDNTNESICKSLPAVNNYQIIHLNYNHLFLGHFKEVANIIGQNVVD